MAADHPKARLVLYPGFETRDADEGRAVFSRQNGAPVYTWEKHSSDEYIPSRSMNLYLGIWEIGGSNVDPPGPFTGDSWMALSMAQVWTSI